MKKPTAVLISDIHFTVGTLELASKALTEARFRAFSLGVPLIICGDTLDSKAIMRAECVNALLDILHYRAYHHVETYVLVGNHDLLNEKGTEHSLRFLENHCTIINKPTYLSDLKVYAIPYIGDTDKLKEILKAIPDNSTIIMHQGVQTAYMGHYVQDKTSLPPGDFSRFRVISGHYHQAQDIGSFTYIGNPYTLTFGEANDGLKGYRILNDDGSLESVPLLLRKHLIIERKIENVLDPVPDYSHGDLVWLKVSGSSIDLENLNKNEIGEKLFGHSSFKFDKIAYDLPKTADQSIKNEKLNNSEMLDHIIDQTQETDSIKTHLKSLWRELLNETSNSNSQ